MDFSLFFFADSAADGDRYSLLLRSARYADANGFSAVWTPERHFHSFGGQYPNPAVIGAALAIATHRLAIRAGSVVAPLHHPARIAEEWSVVDNLSGGRAGVSFASGWHPDDFVLRPQSFADRKKTMAETIDQVRRLWRGEEVEFPDLEGKPQAVRILPAPVQPELPFWITAAGSPETFRLAGTLGAGVLTHQLGQSRDVLAQNIATYRAALAAAHGTDARGHVAVMLHAMIGTDRDRVREVVRGPMSEYLSGSVDLIARDPASAELGQLSPQNKAFLVARAFDRYFESAGLFGTVDDGVATARGLAAIGVDEIACLIDFGVAQSEVLGALEHLGELRGAFAGERVAEAV
jgi:natural product biosynthesis luciferase-like monooxygenase protein